MENHIAVEEKKQDKGFTLVELLIVIVILGILATVTVFAVRGITDKGQTNACAVERRTLDTAIEAYFADTGADPARGSATCRPGYIKSVPDVRQVDVRRSDAVLGSRPASFTSIGVCVGA